MQSTNLKEKNVQKPKHSKKRMLIVLLFIIIIAIGIYISYRGSYLETLEIGEQYLDVLKQNLLYKYVVMAVNFIILFLFIYITNRFIKKGLKSFFAEEKKEMPKLPNKSIALIISAIISIFTSEIIAQKVMLFTNAAWFGVNDPVFNTDIGYYFFKQPFIEFCIGYFIIVMILLTAYVAIYYIIVFNKYFDGINAQTLKTNTFLKHIIVNAMLITIGIALFIILNAQGITTDGFLSLHDESETKIIGAGITDVTIKLWGYRILAIVIVISIYRAICAFKKKDTKKVFFAILAVPIYLVIMFLIMTIFQLVFINANELDKQKTYIENNIKYTKKAYNIEIEEKQLNATGTITKEEANTNKNVINNIPVISSDITYKTLSNLQTSTGYYSFRKQAASVYNIDGKDTLVYVSPREISNSNSSYNNKTYEYTHGFGTIITDANQSKEDGNIKYIKQGFVNDEEDKIKVNEPRIYYGLETKNTIVTNTKNKVEFDYPTNTAENATFVYNGKAGLNLNLFDRLILAIKEKDMQLALSTNVNNDSKILINRNIIQRAEKIMPNLIYDENPYMVIDDNGNQIWVIDAYTVSSKYPYSQTSVIEYKNKKQTINYIRNSIKVLVNSYDGSIDFYITDETDPIAIAYNKIYPTLFKKADQIPEGISKHFVYPQYLYDIQAKMLNMYHNVGTDVLYRGDDIWEIANYTSTGTKATSMESYYTMLKTVDGGSEKLGLVIPYTPLNKQNITAYLVGETNGTNKKLTLYKFSSDSNMIGATQLDKQIEEDENIAKEIASVNVTGTKLVRNMIIVPIENTLLYVEPIYQQTLNETASVPVLKKVIVASGNKVAIGNNLEEALNNLLSSEYTSNIEVENTDTKEGLIEAIIKANENLDTSSSNNNWEQIGKDLARLQELIDELEKVQEEEKQKQEEIDKMTQNKENTLNQNNVVNNVIN